jgi:hypothetical protein
MPKHVRDAIVLESSNFLRAGGGVARGRWLAEKVEGLVEFEASQPSSFHTRSTSGLA